MARIKIDEVGCSSFFKTINTYIADDLTSYITSFNKELDILNNGITWRGSDAVDNVGKLVECYNSFIKAYNQLINYFIEEVPKVFVHYNEIIVANGGASLNITGVSTSTFSEKTLNDLSFGGEDGNPDELDRIKPILANATKGIQDTFTKIKNKMDEIGNGSETFDTSAATTNYADNIKNEVKSYISDLDSKYDESLYTCLNNISTSSKNLRG